MLPTDSKLIDTFRFKYVQSQQRSSGSEFDQTSSLQTDTSSEDNNLDVNMMNAMESKFNSSDFGCDDEMQPSLQQQFRMNKYGSSSMILFDLKEFEDRSDRLNWLIRMMNRHRYKMKSFSTIDLDESNYQDPSSSMLLCGSNETTSMRRYQSDCDLASYYRFTSNGKYNRIKYSSSTLAICGDTINSSQLPSPQAQSFRQLNSMIFTDFDLAKSFNKKIINKCINRILREFVKIVDESLLSSQEIDSIAKIGSDIIVKPLKRSYDFQYDPFQTGDIFINVVDFTEQSYDSEDNFTKKDKEKFVLNWLQTVQPRNKF
ncbi:Intraflagellar transport protein 140-like protein [Sarcoptes scabiei]|nr:Intraflagellar transport protein 140-like protein [Sarcoptes scabiei]